METEAPGERLASSQELGEDGLELMQIDQTACRYALPQKYPKGQQKTSTGDGVSLQGYLRGEPAVLTPDVLHQSLT